MNTKNQIVEALEQTNREGTDNLINYLNSTDFFTAPASTRWHNAFEGGLASHSMKVASTLYKLLDYSGIKVDKSTIIIAGLLHDLCKIGCYGPNAPTKNYLYIDQRTTQHSRLSLSRVSKHIQLSLQEERMILFHMGPYGTEEFGGHSHDYSFKEMIEAWNNYPETKLMYFADNLATLKEQNATEKD